MYHHRVVVRLLGSKMAYTYTYLYVVHQLYTRELGFLLLRRLRYGYGFTRASVHQHCKGKGDLEDC
jgi:hypothetical protein